MRIGEKIKRIRKFRKLTQKELSHMVGLDEKGHRIVQYEIGERVPKKELTDKIAEALSVNPRCLYEESDIVAAEDIMFMLFWLEESIPGCIGFIELEMLSKRQIQAKRHLSEDLASINITETEDRKAYYLDNDAWPALAPVGMYFNYGVLNSFLKDWAEKRKELEEGRISRDEYFEWKITWPDHRIRQEKKDFE